MSSDKTVCCKCGCLKKCSNGIVAGLERLFYKIGGAVARNPWKTILSSVLVCGLMGVGLIKWHEETEYVKVWLPRGSRVEGEYRWVNANFPERVRFESVVVEDENVLTPQSINAMYDLYDKARRFQSASGKHLNDFCIKTGPLCRVNSILELWLYNRSIIRNITEQDIFQTVNQDKIISPLYQNELRVEKLLGHVQRDKNNKIIGAKAATFFWFLERNKTTESSAMDWEKQLISLVNDEGHPHLQNLYVYTARTFDDEALGALSSDVNLLTIGFSLVFIYLSLSIGQFSLLHHKILLAAAGLLSIAMSIVFTYGFGFVTGIMFGPIHQITPFMLLGIGVDDIFVIMESMRHLTAKEKEQAVDVRIASALKHAGVSITVTSITDIVAFAIGSSTVIPSLSTFCVYAAIGVLALYILQSTFFVACLALDESRRDARRNACIVCYTHHESYKPNSFYTFSIQHQFMKNVWGPALTKKPIKVLVVLITIGLTSVNVWSFIHLKHDFDPSMYLPTESYSQKYVTADRKYFPGDGAFVQLFCGKADYANNIDRFMDLYEEIRSKPTVQTTTVDFWLASYQQWKTNNDPRINFAYNPNYVPNPSSSITASDDPFVPVAPTKDYIQPSGDNASIVTSSNSRFTKESVDKSPDITTDPSDLLVNKINPSTVSPDSVDLSSKISSEILTDSVDLSSNISSNNSSDSNGIGPSFILSDAADIQSQSLMFFASLRQFFMTLKGQTYIRAIKMDSFTAPTQILGSMMTFRHVKCQTSKCNIDAMTDLRELVDSFQFRGGGTCFVYSNPQYMFNETNKVLKVELYRNLALAAVCVFIVTLVLITNIWTSMLVFIGVVCTVIDVAGTMNFWDISVDTASSVILILCFGLAVDYSAHVGHCFMTRVGSRDERLKQTLINIGPAVFSGGFSTFLAFLLLVNSASYGFTLFFRIFTSVVVFGLFHGLAFLPVVLSIVGPPSYETQIFCIDHEIPKTNGDHANGAMIPNGNGEPVEMREFPFKQYNDDMTPNGHVLPDTSPNGQMLRAESEGNIDPNGLMDDRNPRYSGSYYEQLSNGSLVQIPFPGPH